MLNLTVAGLAAGGTYALIGVCIVFLHRVAAVVNFSATFGPTFAVFSMSSLIDTHEWGLWTSIAAALAIGAGIAALQGFVMARFFRESTVLIRSTVTMAMAIMLFGITIRVFGDVRRFFPVLFNSLSFRSGDVRVTGQVVVAFLGAIVVGITIGALLRFTRVGVILRAISARPVTAELMGVRTLRAVVGVWMLSGLIVTAALILVAPTRASIPGMSMLIVPGLAAAVFGRLSSFSLAIIGGTLLGILESVALDWGTIGNYRPTLSFILVTAALFWSQRKETWSEAR